MSVQFQTDCTADCNWELTTGNMHGDKQASVYQMFMSPDAGLSTSCGSSFKTYTNYVIVPVRHPHYADKEADDQ